MEFMFDYAGQLHEQKPHVVDSINTSIR